MSPKKILTPESYKIQLNSLNNTLKEFTHNSDISEILILELFCKNGSTIWGEIHAKILTDKNGSPEFSYAHPLFWAPFTLVGDGGK